eukprot:13096650-Alexandrium_andersonii.AAC.1
MASGSDGPPGLEPEARPPPKRQRSAPPVSSRTTLDPIAEEGIGGGAPARARPPSRNPGSRSQNPSFATATSEESGAAEPGRLPRASSRPTSLGPTSQAPTVEIYTPPRTSGSPSLTAPLLLSPTLDPISGTPQETAAYLADVARAVNTLQGE